MAAVAECMILRVGSSSMFWKGDFRPVLQIGQIYHNHVEEIHFLFYGKRGLSAAAAEKRARAAKAWAQISARLVKSVGIG